MSYPICHDVAIWAILAVVIALLVENRTKSQRISLRFCQNGRIDVTCYGLEHFFSQIIVTIRQPCGHLDYNHFFHFNCSSAPKVPRRVSRGTKQSNRWAWFSLENKLNQYHNEWLHNDYQLLDAKSKGSLAISPHRVRDHSPGNNWAAALIPTDKNDPNPRDGKSQTTPAWLGPHLHSKSKPLWIQFDAI